MVCAEDAASVTTRDIAEDIQAKRLPYPEVISPIVLMMAHSDQSEMCTPSQKLSTHSPVSHLSPLQKLSKLERESATGDDVQPKVLAITQSDTDERDGDFKAALLDRLHSYVRVPVTATLAEARELLKKAQRQLQK